jgi:uncharacterized protein (TIGR03437 family)
MRPNLLGVSLALPAVALAQYYNVSTIAGTGKFQFTAGLQAIEARLVEPRLVALDSAGNFYVSDTYYEQVFQVTPSGVISVYAGNGTQGFSGDEGLATAAQLNFPQGLVVDSSDNLYIADTNNYRVRKVTPAGVISTYAEASSPVTGLTIDASGNLYATSGQNLIKIDTTGNVTTIAGNNTAGYAGDGGPATSAEFYNPYGIRVDSNGNIYVADGNNNRIRKITPQGIISTVVGSGKGGFLGDGGQATKAEIFHPNDVALDRQGNLYISDGQNGRIRVVDTSGEINTYAGGGGSLEDGPVTQAELAPVGLAVDSSGNLLVAEFNFREVRRINTQQSIATVAGMLPTNGADDSGPATSAYLLSPLGVAVDSTADILISDYVDNRIRKVSPAGIITTVTGNGIPGYTASGLASSAEIAGTTYISFDKAGDLLFADGVIQEVAAANGDIATIAGDGAGFAGDGGPAASALLLGPDDAVEDANGNIYIADKGNNRIRKVNAQGIISTIAGNGMPGFSGDGGPAANAEIFQPYQLALDSAGDLFIADWGNARVRKINTAGIISTVAGGSVGALGDGGPATAANVSGDLSGVALDSAGNLYIATATRIRKVAAATGIISTIAGTGREGFSGDGGLATNAEINGALGLAVDASGTVYFTDGSNFRVRKLTPAQIVKEGVENGATFQAGGVAPGEIVTIFAGPGVSLGPATAVGIQLTSTGLVSSQVAGTQVTFDGHAAPILYLSSSQVNVVVPYEVAGESSTVLQVTVQGTTTNTVTLPVVASSPGVFAIANGDYSVNSPSNPAPAGGVVVLYGTGEGQTDPAGIDGGVNNTTYPKPVLPVTVQIAGQNATILYAGAAPGFVAGVLQVDVQIPAGLSGTVPIQLSVGTESTPSGLTISVH